LGLGASLELLARYGAGPTRSAIAERVLEITDVCCERLAEIGAQVISSRQGRHRSGIVAFEIPGTDAKEVKRKCLESGVVLSARGGWLRVSPHAYTNHDDIERLIAALELTR
jgi:selenocysteine lyase/cysteine desulfurase